MNVVICIFAGLLIFLAGCMIGTIPFDDDGDAKFRGICLMTCFALVLFALTLVVLSYAGVIEWVR